MTARLVLIRHGEPVGHEGRCVGHCDTELAASAANALRRIAHVEDPPRIVVASDLRRASHSASLLAGAWKAELRFDPRLRELSFGDWEGRLWSDIARDDAAAMQSWGDDWTRASAPGGETGQALAARARSVLDDLIALARTTDTALAVVSHAGWIRVATTLLLDEPLQSAFDRSIDYAHAAVFRIDRTGPKLIHWNVETLGAPATVSASALPPAPPSAPL